MANKTIGDYPQALSIDNSTDMLLMEQNATDSYRKINRNTLLGTSGTLVDTNSPQSISNKTLDNTTVASFLDTRFTLQDDGNPTRQARFQLDNITPGNTRVYTLPDQNTGIAGTTASQNLLNKTITSPIINGGTINNPTLNINVINESTVNNGVTIDGLNIKDGAITTPNSVPGASIVPNSLTKSQIDWGLTGGIWWEELGRTTLNSAAATIGITINPALARTYLKVIFGIAGATNTVTALNLRLNNDFTSSYVSAYTNLDNTYGYGVNSTSGSIPLLGSTGTVWISPTSMEIDILDNAGIIKFVGTCQNVVGSSNVSSINTGSRLVRGIYHQSGSRVTNVQISVGGANITAGSSLILLGHN